MSELATKNALESFFKEICGRSQLLQVKISIEKYLIEKFDKNV